jgi:hypothetical protein
MNPMKIVSISLLTLAMTACGGGSPNSADGGSSDTPADASPDSPESDNTITNISFGSGTGVEFVPSAITLSKSYSLLAGALQVSVDVVDNGNANVAVAQAYQFEFSSTCSSKNPKEASFSVDTLGSDTGNAATTYRNIGCRGSDTITVKLLSQDGTQELASAEAVVPAYVPQLGFGSGASFVAGKIDGNTNLIDEASTTLTVNAVDGLNLNSLINSANYVAQWDALCAAATFSIDSQPLSTSNIVTRYDANTCTGTDTVTVKLFAKDDLGTPLDSTTTSLTIGETASVGALPKLGTGNGSGFNAGQLDLGASYVLAGGSLVIGVNGVNELDANALLTSDYIYKFKSSCTAGTTRFSSDVITTATGQVTNTYFNQTCSGGDTITVELFAAGADISSATPFATAATSFNTAVPQLGFGNGAGFVVGSISGNANLVDEASTMLSATVVDPLNVNKELNTADYYIAWKDDCSSDQSAFSIVTQNISTQIETRYDADAVACRSPQVTLELFNQFNEVLDSVNLDLTIAEGLEPEQPLLGTGLAAGFVSRDIELSESTISARQTVAISVNIVDGKDDTNTLLNSTEYAVSFNSVCAADDRASFDVTEKRTTSGQVTVYYTASGCVGTDRINATLYAVENNTVVTDSSLAIATTVLTINSPAINSVEYQGMTTRQIAMKGISFSDLPEVTAVTFLIKDEYNIPASGKKVFFTLSNPSVDATLSGIKNLEEEVEVTTNAEGLATAFVNSGTTHGLVSVKAEITRKAEGESGFDNSDRIRTQSFGISITTGLPVQSAFTMVADTYNPRGWNILGETVNVTVNLSDHFQNPVPDGTRINFTADGGKVQPSCETAEGVCSVEWTSAKPLPGFNKDNGPLAKQKSNQYHDVEGVLTRQVHPTNDPTSGLYFNRKPDTESELKCGDGSPEQDAGALCDNYRLVDEDSNWNGGRSGVVTILAYTQGEVGFADGGDTADNTEGNGRFDSDEYFSPMAEAYLDANENGKYDIPDANNPYEELIEFDNNGAYTEAPTFYQGGNCSDGARLNGDGHCSEPVHIRQSIQLVMASDYVDVRLESATGEASGNLDLTKCINVYNEKSVQLKFSVADYNGNTPIKGTGLTFEIADFSVTKAPDVVANSNNTYAHTAYLTLEPGDVFSSSIAQLVAAHPDDGIAGFAETPLLSDDPRIKIDTTDYLMNASAGSQIIALQFEDGCGLPPQDSDVIIIEATGVKIGTFDSAAVIVRDNITNIKTTESSSDPRADFFQIYGRELRDNGEIFLKIERSVNLSTVLDAESKTQEATQARNAAQIPYDSSKAIYDNRVVAYAAAQESVSEKTTDRDNKKTELADLQDDDPVDSSAIAAAENALATAESALIAAGNALTTADNNKQTAETQLAEDKSTFDQAANLAEAAISEEEDIKSAYALSDGSIKVRAINRSAGGIETNKSFDVRL